MARTREELSALPTKCGQARVVVNRSVHSSSRRRLEGAAVVVR